MASDLESADEKPHLSKGGSQHQAATIPPQTTTDQDTKANLVDWDGPDDPKNPRNWPTWQRYSQVVLASIFLLTACGPPSCCF